MKRQIQELAEQAGIHPTNFEPDADIKESLEKFAELIVEECADLCERFGESGDGYTCSAEILEHFGVEE